MMGININDECQDFTGQILRGEKTIETRKTRSLDPYIGERVGLVRTGVGKATLVGYATIGEPVVYDSVAKFRRDYEKHLVAPGSAFDIKDGVKYGYPVMQVEAVDPRQVETRGIVARRLNPYTKPDLRERLKRKIMAGSKGGNPGQWSARKAQLLAAEYEKAGGGYTGKRSASQRSLSKWTKEDWRTKSGKPSLETGERYLPAAAITALTSAEYAETSRAKRKATGQFSRQPKRIAMKTSEFRNPKDPRSAMTQITGTEDTYINASKMLGGKVLDYGAGRGIGTDALRSNGLLADSFEPFPENWEGKRPPTYTDSANIPSDSYDSLVSFSVINVVDPDERKFLFQEVARILRPDGVALITGRDRQDVQKATTKIPHLEEGGYLIGKGKLQRYQKGFTQAELERYAKEVLGPGFTVEANRALNGASIKITKGKPNPAKRNAVRSKLSRIIEPGDRILCYDTASGEDFYRLWDVIHTAMPMTKEALVEVEGMLDDDGVLVIESGETPAGLQDHFRRATRYNGLLLVQGPKNPEQARIETEKLRRELE
jgi:SAM-dependent methyltransferase